MDQSPNPLPGEKDDGGGEKPAAPANLLEERWFFNNFLDKKTSMSRENSDQSCTSSGGAAAAGKSYDEAYKSIVKLPRPSESRPPPPSLVRKGSIPVARGGAPSEMPPALSNLGRMPSMPASIASSAAAEEIHDEEEEIEFSMGKLIRQASLKSSDSRRLHVVKGGGTPVISPSTSSSRKAEFGSRKLERLRPRRAMNQLKTQKSLSDLEAFELQGFKDLGFDVGLKKQGSITMIPESHEEDEERKQSAPQWGGKRSKEDDMKAQIKFWARAVASNVNQD